MTEREVSNTVLVTIDALRADHLSQYGYKRDTMPVLDRLDREGTRFASAFSNGANTGASLPSLLSSRYRGVEPCTGGPTIASLLNDSGMKTAGFHSNTLLSSIVGRVNGFEDFEDFGVGDVQSGKKTSTVGGRFYNISAKKLKHIVEQLGFKPFAKQLRDSVLSAEVVHSVSYYIKGDEVSETVIEWLRDNIDEEFFLWVHYMDPHRPYGIDLDNPKYCDDVTENEILNLMSKAGVHPESVTTEERLRMIDLYDSDLRYTSQAIGRLFNELVDLNIWEDSAIILAADHGEEFREHGNFFHRNQPYDELLHIPLFVKHPNYGADVVSSPRELLDIAPTICEMMDINCESHFRGKPLSQSNTRRIIAKGPYAASHPSIAVRWGNWKYISTEQSNELYNLSLDPNEQQNVASEYPATINRYKRVLPNSLVEEPKDNLGNTTSEEVVKRLQGLGYME